MIEDAAKLVPGLRQAYAKVAAGGCCFLDVHVTPGYENNVAG